MNVKFNFVTYIMIDKANEINEVSDFISIGKKYAIHIKQFQYTYVPSCTVTCITHVTYVYSSVQYHGSTLIFHHNHCHHHFSCTIAFCFYI